MRKRIHLAVKGKPLQAAVHAGICIFSLPPTSNVKVQITKFFSSLNY